MGKKSNCARLLDRIRAATAPAAEAAAIVRQFRDQKKPVPGFGHHLHKPVDPRAYKLLELAQGEPELEGLHLGAQKTLAGAVDAAAGRPITLNATGAVAAPLVEIGVPTVMRGFAVISRAAGLVAHVVEEQRSPSGRFIWDTVEHSIAFVDAQGHPLGG